ncbi:F0F1 ATP synthase subunit B [Sphingomonas oleivorans]|uniref:ATP synthase subunit b n=1 Tax=Sphingomonas oleivorans TaxID=1735121 RepID=A0A2T5FUV8_9SPHN|nr:F0F1 ATP synthase subunit B [Sphingomonas oleivorans]
MTQHSEAPAAETVAHQEAHGAAPHADPSALGLDATGWVSLAMLALILIMLWKKVPAVVGGALDKKIDSIRAQLDEATKLRAEAEALKAEYEVKAATAGKEAEAILAHARSEASSIVAQAQSDAQTLIERRGRMAEDKIAAAERAALAEVRAKAAEAAAAAAATLIARNHGAEADKALVDSTIASLGTSGRLN